MLVAYAFDMGIYVARSPAHAQTTQNRQSMQGGKHRDTRGGTGHFTALTEPTASMGPTGDQLDSLTYFCECLPHTYTNTRSTREFRDNT